MEAFDFEDLDFWRLCDELSIREAALLIAGCDPAGKYGHVENWKREERPPGYEAAKTAIRNALRKDAIAGTIVLEMTCDSNGNEYPADGTLSLDSRVEVEALREWLSWRGLSTGFFFPAETDSPDYLNPKNPRYAPKLAAAVRAWQAVIDPAGKHPKQALMKWLREHAAEYNLSDEEGKPNETGIEEAAKIANWQPGGGAPKTPGS